MKKLSILALSLFFFAACSSDQDDNQNPSDTSEDVVVKTEEVAQKECVTKTPKTVTGSSMAPLIPNGTETVLLENYYNCGNSVQVGDVVAYNFAGNKLPLIKRVFATDQDEVVLEGGKVIVNGNEILNSAEKPYRFSTNEQKMLGLYIKNGKIPKDSILIFGENPINSDDSRKFGAVSTRDLFGKFEY